jgi:hypothetical protein
VRLADAILVEDTRGHLKSYKRLGIRTIWIVGHLPARARADGTPARLPGTGRPHYVDRRIRSLKSLRLGNRSARLKGRQTCSRFASMTRP